MLRSAELLIATNDAHRARFTAYWRQLEALDALLKSALEHNWKIFGRVLARQSFLTLSGDVEEIRNRAVQMVTDAGFEKSVAASVLASEEAFRAALEQHQAELARSQDPQWMQQLLGCVLIWDWPSPQKASSDFDHSTF